MYDLEVADQQGGIIGVTLNGRTYGTSISLDGKDQGNPFHTKIFKEVG
jgi:hypothetical protein